MSKKRDDPKSYVSKSECAQITASIKDDLKGVKDEIKTVRIALVGEDMRGGLVKDVSDIKKERSTATEILKSVVVPIIIAVVTAIIVSAIR